MSIHEGDSPFEFFSLYKLSYYYGYYYPTHCMWSTPASIRGEIAALKKLAKLLVEAGIMTKDEYELGMAGIEANLDVWTMECEDYNDPDEPNPYAFF
ncbi:hypothetical protein IM774_04705 [Erysipelotrichaceae bacterium RD49]|nr:hypothetical protein [Erysipelotrichaceae bacterium RD49]